MKALIIGSGCFSKKALELLDEDFYTICADGGYDSAVKCGIIPDIVIGDMDSVKENPDTKTIVFPKEKDETDSEIAIDYAIDNGFFDLVLAGFSGTRLDHTLNNVFLLKKASDRGAKAVISDDNNEIYFIDKEITLKGKCGDFLSVIPLSEKLEGVTTKNLKYPLNNETLFFGKSRGISNEFLTDECTISVKTGFGIVIKAED